MTAANTRAGGLSFTACEAMIPFPGPNFAPNNRGIPNVANYFCCGGNEQNLGTLRITTQSSGGLTGVISGTHSGVMQPLTGSAKYYIQGLPATRLGDISLANAGNCVSVQTVPGQTKYFINV